jgi:hypothetical protein
MCQISCRPSASAEDRNPPISGTVLEVSPAERLVLTWGADRLTFELASRQAKPTSRGSGRSPWGSLYSLKY